MARKKKMYNYEFIDCKKSLPSSVEVKCSKSGEKVRMYHKQLIKLRDQGCAIILVSVELDEILGLSDRILVMNKGQEVSTVNGDDANPKDLGLMMAGISQGASN